MRKPKQSPETFALLLCFNLILSDITALNAINTHTPAKKV